MPFYFEQSLLHSLICVGEQDINMRVLQMIRNEHIKVIKCHYTPRGNTALHQTELTMFFSVSVVQRPGNQI